MKKSEIKYIVLLLSIFAVYVLIEYNRPVPLDWRVTYSAEHKIPFGGMVLEDILSDHFTEFGQSYYSAYELLDTMNANALMTQSLYFSSDDDEVNRLLEWVDQGSTLLISAEYLGYFEDTLGMVMEDIFFDTLNLPSFKDYDSIYLEFVNPEVSGKRFWMAKPHANRYFSEIDSANTSILAINDREEAVIVKKEIGEGSIIVSAIPMALTNYYLLKPGHDRFADYLLSYVDGSSIHWTEFYQTGRVEPPTPLRYILSERSLRWAYYILIISVILFVLFRIKRTQRIIPILKPLSNATKEFTQTLGNLYMHSGNHRDAAEKKITYFFEFIRSHYFMDTQMIDEEFYELLSKKSGTPRKKVDYLFKMITHVQSKGMISRDQLLELNTKIDEFYSIR